MRAVAYARFSSDNQREESIDAQLRAINEYCDRYNIELIDTYADEAKSATSDRRPAFQRMVADSAEKSFQAVIVHKLDRFSRDRFDSAFYRRELKRNGVKLISVLENLDDSPESVILESVLEGMAEYFSKNLAREVRKGQMENGLSCRHNGGRPPIGYDVLPDGHYCINEEEAATVRMIFSMYANGHGYGDILAALHGKKTKIGGEFGKNSLHDMLTNEKYIGNYIYNKAASAKDGKRNNHAQKDESEIVRIEGGMPRIIDDETWSMVRERMSSNKHKGDHSAKVCYLLAGKLVCGKCGSTFVGRTLTRASGYRWSKYICGTKERRKTCDMPSISKDAIEESVITEVEKMYAFDPGRVADIIMQQFDVTTVPESVEQARRDLKKVENQLSNILESIKAGVMWPGLKEEVDALVADQSRLKPLTVFEPVKPRREELIAFVSSISDIRSKSPEEQRSIIDRVIEKIVIYDDGRDPVIYWRIRGDRKHINTSFTASYLHHL